MDNLNAGIVVCRGLAQAFDKFGGKLCGTFGDVGCFSTHLLKILMVWEMEFELLKKPQ